MVQKEGKNSTFKIPAVAPLAPSRIDLGVLERGRSSSRSRRRARPEGVHGERALAMGTDAEGGCQYAEWLAAALFSILREEMSSG